MIDFGFLPPPPVIGGMNVWMLKGLVGRWCRDLSPPEFKLVVYFFRRAADTPDGVVRRPRKEIAEAVGIRMRDIRPMLKGLEARGAFEVVLNREETVVKMGPSSSLPPAVSEWKRPATIANLKEVLLRLTGIRVGMTGLEDMKRDAQVNDKELMEILDSFLRRGDRFEGLGLLTVGVQYQDALNKHRYGTW